MNLRTTTGAKKDSQIARRSVVTILSTMIDIEKLVIVLVIVRFVDMNAAVALYDDQWAIDGLKNCER